MQRPIPQLIFPSGRLGPTRYLGSLFRMCKRCIRKKTKARARTVLVTAFYAFLAFWAACILRNLYILGIADSFTCHPELSAMQINQFFTDVQAKTEAFSTVINRA
jgi:hypothetical protein